MADISQSIAIKCKWCGEIDAAYLRRRFYKHMITADDIALDKRGIRIPDPKSGKLSKFIPWGLLNREKILPNVDKITGRNRDFNFEVFYVRKTIDGNKLEKLYPSQREALKAIDIFLIRSGRDPQHILQKS